MSCDMQELSIKLLVGEQVKLVWPAVVTLVEYACVGNEIAADEMDAQHVFDVVLAGRAVMFVGYDGERPACVLVLRMFTANGHKGANVMVLGGERALGFKAAFWGRISGWLISHGVEFVDACVPSERAHVYARKFGFNKSCAYIRKNLVAQEVVCE